MFSAWAEVVDRTHGQLGYAKTSPIAEKQLDTPHHQSVFKGLPRDILLKGYRLLLALDQGLIRPKSVELRTVKQRADFTGVTVARYYYLIRKIQERLN